VSWVDQADFQLRKVEFYDRRGDLLKVLELSDYRQYENGIWRAHLLSMSNVQTNKQTDLVYEAYAFDPELADSDFVKGRLSRLR
jgi:outer membrane lipoprotein-sorting protein